MDLRHGDGSCLFMYDVMTTLLMDGIDEMYKH